MNDNDRPRRAAESFKASTLPPHGRHAGPHDPGLAVRDLGDGGGSIVIPSRAVATPEKSSAVYQAKLAEPSPRRRGARQSEEQLLQRDVTLAPYFQYGVETDRAVSSPSYEKKVAQPSPLARDSDLGGPAWDRVPNEVVFGFMQDGEVLSIPDRRERVSNTYEKVIAPPAGGRRYNPAQIRHGGRP